MRLIDEQLRYKRNEEALGNILWATQDDKLIQRAIEEAKSLAEDRITSFVSDTIDRVRATPRLVSARDPGRTKEKT